MPENLNTSFYEKTERAFRQLFDAALEKYELHFAMSLMPELRGAQDFGWNTAYEAETAFNEYLDFIDKLENGPMKCRVALAFHSHIAEAAGFYEVPKNMLSNCRR